MATEFKLPELGENIASGDVVTVFVSEGDVVKPGQSLLEVETDKAVMFADSVLAKHDEFTWRFANSGRGNPQVYYNEIPSEQASNVGGIYARFDKWESKEGNALLEELRAELATYPGVRFNVKRFLNGPPIEAPIAIRIQGADIEVLSGIAADVERAMAGAEGIRNITNPLAERLLDLDLNINTEAAALRGVPAGAMDQTLRIAIGGARVASFRDPVGDAYPVIVRAPRGSDEHCGPRSALHLDGRWFGRAAVGVRRTGHFVRPRAHQPVPA